MKKMTSFNNSYRMKKQKEYNLPSYTVLEEVLNSITHGLGVVFAIVAIILLLKRVPRNFNDVLGVSIYGFTLFLLYIVSTLYHSLHIGRAKKVFRVLDHCSIFLMIAGTYTPITSIVIGGWLSKTILSIVWSAAVLGIVVNWIDLNKYTKFSMACYIIMGWGIVFAIKPLIDKITVYQLWMLLAGGIAYTIGAVLYVLGKKIRYIHSVWHLFVLLGGIFHFLMIYSILDI